MRTATILPLLAFCVAMASAGKCLAADTNPLTWTATANADWRPVEGSTTYVMPGSALDMSRFVEAPAGKYGRVVLDNSGHLVFEKKPEQRVLFFGCSIAPHQVLGEWCQTKPAIREWAESVRRQGYNLVRPHFLDHYLTGASKRDLEFDPEALNSRMTLTGPERETLVALGKPPVLLRTGRLKITLTGRHLTGMKLWSLGLDGRRQEAINADAKGNTLSWAIDTSRLRFVTPFFEACCR